MSPRALDWQADFSVFDANDQLAVIAEAKNKAGTDPQWAANWLRNYLAHQQSAAPLFLLLATPGTLYLWKKSEKVLSSEPMTADARGLFASYLGSSKLEASDISGRTFEFIVGAWLDDVSHGLWLPSTAEERHAFADSGFLQAVGNGRVVAAIAA